MVIRKTKTEKVIVNAGATVEITQADGTVKRYGCSGTNGKTGYTPAQVMRNLQDCIQSTISGKPKRKRKK